MRETLDLLDALGIDTARCARNDRKLLFEDVGIVTMRPSDVPTYVEAGAADVGITGKDVLTEQAERDVYELLDLGFGRCAMVARDRRRRPTRRPRRCAGSASCASRRSTRRSPPRTSSATGRQAEIVEVKGSVELAPLTGLVEAIVDLTATGTTLRENGLVIREEIVVSHRAADRQPGRAQAQGGGDRRRAGAAACALERVARSAADPAALAARAARARAGAGVGRRRGRARSSPTVRDGGDARAARATSRASTPAARRRRAARRAPRSSTPALAALDPTCAPASRSRSRTSRAVADAGVGERRARSRCRRASASRCARCRSARAAIYVPGGRAPYPSHASSWASSPRAPPASSEVVVLTPPPVDPVILGACALCGVDEVYAMGGAHGDRRARLRDRDDRARRRDRRARQPLRAGGQAPGLRRASGSTASPGPSDVLVLADGDADAAARRARPARPGRARRRRAPVVAVAPTTRRCSTRSQARARARSSADDRRRAGGVRARRRADAATTALAFAEAFAPEHLELVGAGAEALAPRVRAPAACSSARAGATAFGDYVAGSNHCLPTGGAARFASGLSPRALPPAHERGADRRTAAAALAAAGAAIARAEGFDVHAESMEARVGENAAS